MCGIAGIIQAGPSSFDPALIPSFSGSLAHRGPDGEGSWMNDSGEVLFVHRRLSIIDLSSRANQPLHYLERYTVIHNGEIYNYPELREELKSKGYVFESRSDTEVIAAAYDHWNAECTDHFDGMFAFAIWDEKEKKLFAARDRFGEKPFFFHYDGLRFYFASEMKALWAAGVAKKPNLKMLFNFITIGYTDNPEHPRETFYENIEKLPAATRLTCLPGGAPTLEKYWDLDPGHVNKRIGVEEAIEEFNFLFRNSVMRRLRSDVRVGSSLSGGLDSSAVLAAVFDSPRQEPASSFHAFTATFPGFEKNEYRYAKEVADRFHISHHVSEISTRQFPENWEKLMVHQEEPVGSAGVYPQFKVFELAADHDIRVLLDGQGADEILAGYERYYKWYWQELFRRRRLFRSRELKAARQAGVSERFGPRNMIAAYFPDFATVVLEKQYLLKALRHPDLDPEFVRHQSGEAFYTTPTYFTLNGVLYFNTCVHGLEELLRYADRNSMAHGMEVRLPFLSHELVEYIFSLPAEMKIRQGRTKWILREAMKGRLPDSVVSRRDKVGFEPPQKTWMSDPLVHDMIREAKKKLVESRVLAKESLNKPIIPRNAYDAGNFDWRYLSAAHLFST
jgi:asparagine synthase (glutamine-hydrolysing)